MTDITIDANRNPISELLTGSYDPFPAGQLKITGTGFGFGPTIALFDRMDGVHGQALSNTRRGDVGRWTRHAGPGVALPRLYEDVSLGRTFFCQRDFMAGVDPTEKYAAGMYYVHPEPFTEFRFSQRRWVPVGKCFPGSAVPGTFPDGSAWKPTWLAQQGATDITGLGLPDANLIFDTYGGGGAIYNSGNDCAPTYLDGSGKLFYTGFSFVQPTFTSWYQSGIVSSTNTEYLDRGESIKINEGSKIRSVRNTNSLGGKNTSITTRSYKAVTMGGWFGWNDPGTPDYSNAYPLITDFYLAIGPNSGACILISDNPVLTLSNDAYIINPDSWNDGEIKFTPKTREKVGYYHVILSDLTLRQNLTAVPV